jgi:pyruvate dehydrogenase E2 component (dihydrolipoamide acetyltransferase)
MIKIRCVMPIEILMPALSPTMTEGTLAKWLKKEGDDVGPGDVIAEIETDKATMEVEAVEEGKIGKILVQAGTANVAVNQCIALLLEDGESKDILKDYAPKADSTPQAVANENEEAGVSKGPGAQKSATPAASVMSAAPKFALPPAPTTAALPRDGKVKASPLAKKLAAELGVSLANVQGTGPKNRIVRADVESAARSGGGSGRVVRDRSEYESIPNSSMRKTIAKRLLESKQWVPHFYLNIECKLDKLMALRADINDAASKDEEGKPLYKVSVNDLVIKAVAMALKKIPDANASWSDDAIIRYTNVDVSVAVAVEGGLITPIIRNADQKAIPQISTEMKDLAVRARKNGLKPEEYQGGGFSISNLGMYGIKQFNAIINPPQACILAIGAGEQRAVIEDGKVVPAIVMDVTLSCDHRAVDGAVGAEFLQAFKHYIERPVMMLV